MSSATEIDIKNNMYYFFDDMININLDHNSMKTDKNTPDRIKPCPLLSLK